jgi:hypothetical protein
LGSSQILAGNAVGGGKRREKEKGWVVRERERERESKGRRHYYFDYGNFQCMHMYVSCVKGQERTSSVTAIVSSFLFFSFLCFSSGIHERKVSSKGGMHAIVDLSRKGGGGGGGGGNI